MASFTTVEHKNQDATIYVGNLDQACDEDILMELFTQVGRVSSVHMPKDKLTDKHNGYGFVEFLDVSDAEYAIQVMSMVKLYEKPLRVSKSSLDKKVGQTSLDVGANLFIGNLDPIDVDEKLLYDTFSAFGTIIKPPKVMREDVSGESKGYGFVSYNCFEASDMAIECMHNQFLCNRQVVVQYAFKKANIDTIETGKAPGTNLERHGSKVERMLAASNPMHKYMNKHSIDNTHRSGNIGSSNSIMGVVQRRPNTMFATSLENSIPLPPLSVPIPPIPPPPTTSFPPTVSPSMMTITGPPPLPPPEMAPPPLPPSPPPTDIVPPLPPPPTGVPIPTTTVDVGQHPPPLTLPTTFPSLHHSIETKNNISNGMHMPTQSCLPSHLVSHYSQTKTEEPSSLTITMTPTQHETVHERQIPPKLVMLG